MICPTLNELPLPPHGKTGWPWTEESPQLPHTMPDGRPWPKISIVTPSYNQGNFIEETIRSVLLQGYPDVEYIIIDGGSTDKSVKIIKKYESWLGYWVSESDRGQSHAINKAFQRASGDIMAWINSDDCYLKNSLKLVAKKFIVNKNINFLHGCGCKVNPDKSVVGKYSPNFGIGMCLWTRFTYFQPSTFWCKSLWIDSGGYVREDLNYCMDRELWIRMGLNKRFFRTKSKKILAHELIHTNKKTRYENLEYVLKEDILMRKKYFSQLHIPWILFCLFWSINETRLRMRNQNLIRCIFRPTIRQLAPWIYR